MSEGVVVADTQLGLVLFNEAAEELLGQSDEGGSMRGWTARFGVCSLETRRPLDPTEDPLARAAAGERTTYQEVLLRGDSSAERRLVLTGVPLLDPNGACWGGMVSLRDVTEQRGLEERLSHSQKMEAIGTLASGVAHDFNNLLSIIRGYAHVVVDSFATEDPRRDDMEELLAAAKKASELTQQLLAVGGRHDGKPRPIDINEVVASVERMMSRILPGRVHLQTRLGGASPVFVDPGKMEQVLLNLIVNARDAIENEGVVTVATRQVPVANRESGTRVELLVEDTGCGMSPDVARRIFEPFFTTKESGKGTGLGLATAFAFVKQAGGTLEVDSEPGRGTRFSIQLPLHRDDRAVLGRSI
jgi:signal transduction histidine kinase